MDRMDNLLQWSVLPDTFFAVGIEAFLGIEAVGIEVGIETEGIQKLTPSTTLPLRSKASRPDLSC